MGEKLERHLQKHLAEPHQHLPLFCCSCPQGCPHNREQSTLHCLHLHWPPSNHTAANKFGTGDSKITPTSGTADKETVFHSSDSCFCKHRCLQGKILKHTSTCRGEKSNHTNNHEHTTSIPPWNHATPGCIRKPALAQFIMVGAGISSVLLILYQPHAAIIPGKTMLALLQGRYLCKEIIFLLRIRKATQNLCFLFSNKKYTESQISHI